MATRTTSRQHRILSNLPPVTAHDRRGLIRWTRKQYVALHESGLLEEGKYEFLNGAVAKKEKNEPHMIANGFLADWLKEVFGNRRVRVEGTSEVASTDRRRNLPEPDVAVTEKTSLEYYPNRPGERDMVLVCEVTVTTRTRDYDTKAALYARAEIPEYWILGRTQADFGRASRATGGYLYRCSNARRERYRVAPCRPGFIRAGGGFAAAYRGGNDMTETKTVNAFSPVCPHPVTQRPYYTREHILFLQKSRLLPQSGHELLDGEIVFKVKNRPHNISLKRVSRWLSRIFGEDYVQTQDPIDVSTPDRAYNAPEPDAAVFRQPVESYLEDPGAEETRLIIEVSDSTGSRDRGLKARLYARAGYAEYWVVDIVRRKLYVYREPAPEEYALQLIIGENATVAPLAAPDAFVRVGGLLPPTEVSPS